MGGLLPPLAGTPALAADGGGAERTRPAGGAAADGAARGLDFWSDDRQPAKTAEQTASEEAARTGRRVEVPPLTTETSQVFANTDGTFTAELSAVPQRVLRDKRWTAVDTTLERRPDGQVRPKAAQDLTLSGGGRGRPLVRFLRDGHTYEVFAPWDLPAPVLDGSHAVYKDVLPDVDLVVQAQPDGFTQNLVVHTPKAAANPALRSIRYPVRARGLGVRTAGRSVSYVDGGGHAVFTGSAPLMWDAGPAADAARSKPSATAALSRTTTAAEAAAPGAAGGTDPVDAVSPEAGSRTAVAEVTATDDAVTVVPDRSFLDNGRTSYPVVIDPPTVRGSLVGWTSLWSNSPSTSFWNTSHALGVGYDAYVDNKKVRSLFQFDTRSVAGKKILHAQFSAYEIWSANCTKKNVELWRTGKIYSSTDWGSPPDWKAKVDTVSAANGYSDACRDANVEFDATAAVAYTAKAKDTHTTLGLRADEGDPIAWKQFMSPKDDASTSTRKPTLSITYVTPPGTKPSTVKMSDPNVACSSSSSPAYIRDTTPTLTATPVSADGGNAVLRPNFDLYAGSSTTPTTLKPSAWTASGTAGTVTPTLVNGQTYRFYARTEYRYTYGGSTGYLYGPWSSGCYFKVDSSGPPQPGVTSVNGVYPECAATTCSGSPENGGVGRTGQFTITANASDVRRYVTWLNGVRIQDKTYAANTATHTVSVTPDKRGSNTLRVQTYDAAGNPGTSRDYLFNVARPAPPVAVWKFDEADGTTAANAQGPAHPLALSPASWDADGRSGAAFRSTSSSASATTGGKVVDTTGSFAVTAWVRLSSRTQATVATQRGTTVGGFQLYYSSGYDRWIFNRYAADALEADTTIVRAVGSRPPVLGAWTHLTGVYDQQAQKIRLYVNGKLEAETAFTTPWAANGAFEIGRWGRNQFDGAIDQVQVYNRVVFPDELAPLTNMENPETGQPEAELLAHWSMDETSGTVAADATGRGNHLSLQPGAALTATDDPAHGNVLQLDAELNGHATAPAMLDASGSYTVAGWVNLATGSKLEDTSIAHSPTVFSFPGTQVDSLRLWYRQEAGQDIGDWNFGVFGQDALTTGKSITTSDEMNPPGGWIHVVGVFDSANQSARLYVTGQREGAEEGVFVPNTFQPAGPMMVGRGRRHDNAQWGNQFPGQLDDLRVYAGVLSEQEITRLATVDEPPVDIG
ncbi:LamG domain-containing protein [Streptomyces sp. NPDC093586]|uniref:LamG domain-containing protein n=1 Tax=Streptomyces sp. NPDC093586 TaxID=3366042 RepID=UPI003813C3E3